MVQELRAIERNERTRISCLHYELPTHTSKARERKGPERSTEMIRCEKRNSLGRSIHVRKACNTTPDISNQCTKEIIMRAVDDAMQTVLARTDVEDPRVDDSDASEADSSNFATMCGGSYVVGTEILQENDLIRQEEIINRNQLKQYFRDCTNPKERNELQSNNFAASEYAKRKLVIKKLQARVQRDRQFLSNMAIMLRRREELLDEAFSEFIPAQGPPRFCAINR
uniref:AlNc14C24G2456 protein n=1 Tax=Albugo laibachii Nc14 TaxID=890382 RepID=F0W6F7_9STRA|nr:AlNc14C24G2456 [Albugo laibachii Nc14]|eukprot:CCA16701.1 AlNc14C24G2456 [Albugo laibachii Nc14]